MAQYDLTSTIAGYLDAHLVLPLLEFIDMDSAARVYAENDLLQAKLSLLEQTNMVDFAMDIYKKLHKVEEVPSDMKAKREQVVNRLKDLQSECGPLLKFIENAALIKQYRQEKEKGTANNLLSEQGITQDSIDALYRYAKFQFDCGNYSGAAEYLAHYRALSNNQEKNFSAMWGKLAAEILMQEWEDALQDVLQLKDMIDSKSNSTPLNLLQQRTWLIHWSLFVFFNHEKGRNGIIELFFQDKYLNAIQTTCPHILRYLATAVITNKRRRNAVKDLVKVLHQEANNYKDPITEFLDCLYSDFDFDKAQSKLVECEELLSKDFFLVAVKDEFMDNARLFIFETYCKIHQSVDIPTLAQKLNLDADATEKFVVGLIRNARLDFRLDSKLDSRLDAKIDSAKNQVIMGTPYTSIYQKVIEKSKGLFYRTYVLSNTVAKSDHAKEQQPQEQEATKQDV